MPHAKLELFSEQIVSLAEFAKALSHPARIQIITFLQNHGPCACGDIVDHIPLSQPSVSRHLTALKDAKLVQEQSRGNAIFYSLQEKQIQRFCEAFSLTLKPQSTQI